MIYVRLALTRSITVRVLVKSNGRQAVVCETGAAIDGGLFGC